MSDWRPPHEGEGRYRRKWLAKAFDVAAAIAVGAVVAIAVCATVAVIYLFPWGLR